MKNVKQAKVPSSEAQETIPRLIEMGLVDRSAKISREGEFRYVPISEGKESQISTMGFEIVEGPAYTMERRSPQERILEELSDLSEDIRSRLPMRWEYVGDIAIIRLDEKCEPYSDRIGKTYAKILDVKTICADVEGVSGEFRRPSMRLLYGDSSESVRLENGINYEMDVTKVMYASGNVDERQRMGNMDCKGETVVDMFAGIGYFTLPMAKYSGVRKIFACEKNPDSYHFLLRNIRRNEVCEKVIPLLGDNRNIPGRDFADRILMGYVQTTSDFLPKALDMVKKGGVIHYHDTFYVNGHEERIRSIFEKECDKFVIEKIVEVKSFAPSVSHYVADVRIL
jgi:Predicted methyltransferase